jgi:murein L,D-transpeptidase YcbB/YkuD
MHDTNMKHAFGSGWRFLSHGCMRLEKPFLLGDILMDHRLDTVMLNSCLRNQQPVPVDLRPKVPVFVLYNTVQAFPDGTVRWFKDIYHLLS